VKVDDLFKTVVAVKGNPEIAKFNFRAKNRWINDGNNRTGLDAINKQKLPNPCNF